MSENEERAQGTGAGPEGDDTLDMDVAEFARATGDQEDELEAGLGGGAGDLGAGGDLSGDFGGLHEEGDEGTPA